MLLMIHVRRSGLVVSASDSGSDEPGFESRRGTRKLLRSIPGQDVHSHCVSGPPSLAVGKIGEWAMCLRIERWPGALDKL